MYVVKKKNWAHNPESLWVGLLSLCWEVFRLVWPLLGKPKASKCWGTQGSQTSWQVYLPCSLCEQSYSSQGAWILLRPPEGFFTALKHLFLKPVFHFSVFRDRLLCTLALSWVLFLGGQASLEDWQVNQQVIHLHKRWNKTPLKLSFSLKCWKTTQNVISN